MSYVVSLANFRPSPRFDGVSWVSARIEESAALTGPWAALETHVFDDPDVDPTDPAMRSVTTAAALLASGWYRLVFLDAFGNFEETEPVGGSGTGILLPPRSDDVRQRSRLLAALYPADPADAEVERALRELVADATALVESITYRALDGSLASATPCTGGPLDMVRLGLRAVTLKAEQLAASGDIETVTATARGRRLRGFSAGPYSETYFSPGELVVKSGMPLMDPDPRLAELLWALATCEARDAFLALATGVQQPAGVVTTFDYRRSGGGYFGAPTRFGVGPDGF